MITSQLYLVEMSFINFWVTMAIIPSLTLKLHLSYITKLQSCKTFLAGFFFFFSHEDHYGNKFLDCETEQIAQGNDTLPAATEHSLSVSLEPAKAYKLIFVIL